jgi:hypothetical protein
MFLHNRNLTLRGWWWRCRRWRGTWESRISRRCSAAHQLTSRKSRDTAGRAIASHGKTNCIISEIVRFVPISPRSTCANKKSRTRARALDRHTCADAMLQGIGWGALCSRAVSVRPTGCNSIDRSVCFSDAICHCVCTAHSPNRSRATTDKNRWHPSRHSTINVHIVRRRVKDKEICGQRRLFASHRKAFRTRLLVQILSKTDLIKQGIPGWPSAQPRGVEPVPIIRQLGIRIPILRGKYWVPKWGPYAVF